MKVAGTPVPQCHLSSCPCYSSAWPCVVLASTGGSLFQREVRTWEEVPWMTSCRGLKASFFSLSSRKLKRKKRWIKVCITPGTPIWWCWYSTWLRSLDPVYSSQVLMYIFITVTKGRGRIGRLPQYPDTEFSKGTSFSKITPLGQCCTTTKQLLHNKVEACHRKPACLASTSLGKL